MRPLLALILAAASIPALAQTAVVSTLHTITLAGKDTIIYSAPGPRFEAPNWTRDGQYLIIDQAGSIHRIPVTGGTPALIPTAPAIHCSASHGVSPDGKSLAISCTEPEHPGTHVLLVPLAGGIPKLLTPEPNSYFHSWSPDGQTILFARPDNGSFNIMAIATDGSAPEHPLTTGTGLSDDPDFSADNHFVYFNSSRSGQMQIWRMHADGSAPEQITHDDQTNWTPHPSPDGKYVVFVSYGKGVVDRNDQQVTLRLLSTKDNTIRTLVHLRGGAGSINVPSWSPDSKRLAYVSFDAKP